jgi:hypothetical protein
MGKVQKKNGNSMSEDNAVLEELLAAELLNILSAFYTTPELHHHIYNSQLLDQTLSQINPSLAYIEMLSFVPLSCRQP